jgi:hypothetical protein
VPVEGIKGGRGTIYIQNRPENNQKKFGDFLRVLCAFGMKILLIL